MARGNLKGLNVSLMIDNYANLNLPLEVWWMGQDMRVWSLDLNERLVYLIFKIISDIQVIGVRSIFLPGGKVKYLPEKFSQVAQIFTKQ